jgi:ring-1,2-phenylacetyl-CoA epoxidase subunit PaaD
MNGPHGAGERQTDVRCPFCGASDAEPFSLFGSQLLTEQWYCRACRTPFERVKDDEKAGAGRADGGQISAGGFGAV